MLARKTELAREASSARSLEATNWNSSVLRELTLRVTESTSSASVGPWKAARVILLSAQIQSPDLVRILYSKIASPPASTTCAHRCRVTQIVRVDQRCQAVLGQLGNGMPRG
jgi:hypothetical protein